MTRLRQMLGQERGFALVIALAVTFVFSMTVVTVIEAATSNTRSSDRSKGRISAYSLAEAGINNAASILTKSNAYDPHVLHPQGTYAQQDCASPPANPVGAASLGDTCSAYSWTYDGGTTTMWGWLDTNTYNWTITSTGSVRNAFGGAPTTRTLVATVHIRAQASQQNSSLPGTTSSSRTRRPNVCNVTLDQTTALSSSLYVEGNLCFKNSAGVSEPQTGPIRSCSRYEGRLVWLSGASKGVGNTSTNPNERASPRRRSAAVATSGSIASAAHTCSPSSPTTTTSTSRPGATARALPPSTHRC